MILSFWLAREAQADPRAELIGQNRVTNGYITETISLLEPVFEKMSVQTSYLHHTAKQRGNTLGVLRSSTYERTCLIRRFGFLPLCNIVWHHALRQWTPEVYRKRGTPNTDIKEDTSHEQENEYMYYTTSVQFRASPWYFLVDICFDQQRYTCANKTRNSE